LLDDIAKDIYMLEVFNLGTGANPHNKQEIKPPFEDLVASLNHAVCATRYDNSRAKEGMKLENQPEP